MCKKISFFTEEVFSSIPIAKEGKSFESRDTFFHSLRRRRSEEKRSEWTESGSKNVIFSFEVFSFSPSHTSHTQFVMSMKGDKCKERVFGCRGLECCCCAWVWKIFFPSIQCWKCCWNEDGSGKVLLQTVIWFLDSRTLLVLILIFTLLPIQRGTGKRRDAELYEWREREKNCTRRSKRWREEVNWVVANVVGNVAKEGK